MSFLKKYWGKFKDLFKQGLTPKQLSLSITVAMVVSLFPIFGVSTIILAALAVRFKLNLPIMIALSYVVEPIKAILFVCFVLPFISHIIKKWNLIYFFFTGLAALIALVASVMQFMGNAECPKTDSGIPMCYLSLLIFTTLIILKKPQLTYVHTK